MSDDFFAQRSAFLRRLFALATSKGNVFASFHQYDDIGRPLDLDQQTTMNLARHLLQKRLIDGTHDLEVWLTSDPNSIRLVSSGPNTSSPHFQMHSSSASRRYKSTQTESFSETCWTTFA